jgi:hypothetical protein
MILEEYPMKAVIFITENAVFRFPRRSVKELLIYKHSEYDTDEVPQLAELISTDTSETILTIDDHHYFGYVALDLINDGIGTVTCKICIKTYDASQLKQLAVGHGKSPFDINQEQKGGFSLIEKRKNPSMFGGKGYTCPESHNLISMETWKT